MFTQLITLTKQYLRRVHSVSLMSTYHRLGLHEDATDFRSDRNDGWREHWYCLRLLGGLL